jgi:hypothetical protein
MLAVGKIIAIADPVITVDKWDGDNAAMSGAPAGSDDYVYVLDDHTVDLGLLSTSAVSVNIARTSVFTNAERGYTVSIREDGELRYGTFEIDEVVDGTVTAGSEEYGIETVGSTASGTNDFSLNSTGKSIQVNTSPASHERIGIIFKAAIDNATEGGGYQQTVSFYITANF